MTETEAIVRNWFALWEKGRYQDLPLHDDFVHCSPFGSISGKTEYLSLVRSNEDKFLNQVFEIQDMMCYEGKACVRYKAIQGDFSLDVSEWIYIESGLIHKIHSYYHIGDIRKDRQLKM